MLKKIFALFSVSALLLSNIIPVAFAQEIPDDKVVIHVFKRDDCLHCQEQKKFLDDLEEERDNFELIEYDINDENNKKLWEDIAELEEIPKVTPITIIGSTVIEGFSTPETTGQRITDLLDRYGPEDNLTINEFIDKGGSDEIVKTGSTCDEDPTQPCAIEEDPFYVDIPFLGTKNVKDYSLPVLSALLGFVDGFNPCAMWVLVTFMVVLAQVGDRRKMWTFAGLFIVAEAIMYHLILTVWFTAWDFVGLNKIVTPLVGLLAVGSGIFFLYEWKTSDGTCKVVNQKQKQKTSKRIKELVEQKFTFVTAIGIIMLALSVNVIEFACSIGIPQAFTKILELNELTLLQTEMYMLTYILFYMFDDFLVFGIALYSFEKIGITTKYSRLSNLIGGILMLILGLILIFNPGFLASL